MIRNQKLAQWILLVGLASSLGCESKTSAPAPSAELSTQKLNELTHLAPVSEADAEVIRKAVEAAVAEQNSAAFEALIDESTLISRILAGIDVDTKFRNDFTAGIRQSGGVKRLADDIMQVAHSGGSYSFVRMVKTGDEIRPMFRMVPEEGGVNHHELILSKNASGQPMIADIHVHLSGEPLSQTMRRLALPAIAQQNSGILARLTGAEAEAVKQLKKLMEANQLMQAGNHAQALMVLNSLTGELQNDKTILLLKLTAAQQVDEAAYVATIRELERLYPEDTSSDLRSIDLLIVQERYEDLLKTVDRLVSSVQDPYLNIYKIDGLIALNRLEEARSTMTQIRQAVPDVLHVYWTEVGLLLKLKDHAATAALLDEIGEKFGIEFGDVSTAAEYADFAASDIGKEWMAKQAGKATTPEQQ